MAQSSTTIDSGEAKTSLIEMEQRLTNSKNKMDSTEILSQDRCHRPQMSHSEESYFSISLNIKSEPKEIESKCEISVKFEPSHDADSIHSIPVKIEPTENSESTKNEVKCERQENNDKYELGNDVVSLQVECDPEELRDYVGSLCSSTQDDDGSSHTWNQPSDSPYNAPPHVLDCFKYTCDICDDSFSTCYDLVQHKKGHTQEIFQNSKKCSVMDTKTSINICTGKQCKFCGKYFSYQSHLLAHEKKQHKDENPPEGSSSTNIVRKPVSLGKGKYECVNCGKRFLYRSHLAAHERIHTGEKPFECSICEKRFSQKSQLRIHLTVHTGKKPYECKLCKKKFSREYNLASHVKSHSGEKPFECSICNRKFAQSVNLNVHMRSHTGEKPFECSFCGKQFGHSTYLKNHIRIHTGEKPFLCTLCPKRFTISAHLKTHMKVHTGEKPFECSMCSKRFPDKSDLTKHIRVHTGEKPYECSTCLKRFRNSSNLSVHIRIHHTPRYTDVK